MLNLVEKKNTSVAHPLFAECVHGEGPPAQLVHATISFGPTESLFLSPCNFKSHQMENWLMENYFHSQ